MLPDAVIATGFPRRVYTTDTYNSLTLADPVAAPVIIDITSAWEQKRAALAAHADTQPIEDHFGPMAENLARLWGARIGADYAEAFTPRSRSRPRPCRAAAVTPARGFGREN